MLCVRFPFLPFPPSFVVLILRSPISPSISTQNAKSNEIHMGLYIEKGTYSKDTFQGVYITAIQHAVKQEWSLCSGKQVQIRNPDITLNKTRNDMFTGWILTRIHSLSFLSIKRYLTRCAWVSYALKVSIDGPNHYRYVVFQQKAAGRPGYGGRKTPQLSAYKD